MNQIVNSYFPQSEDPGVSPVITRLKEIISYNTAGGKLNRGCAVVYTAQLLGCQDKFKATVLGWCIEMLQVRSVMFVFDYFDATFCLF